MVLAPGRIGQHVPTSCRGDRAPQRALAIRGNGPRPDETPERFRRRPFRRAVTSQRAALQRSRHPGARARHRRCDIDLQHRRRHDPQSTALRRPRDAPRGGRGQVAFHDPGGRRSLAALRRLLLRGGTAGLLGHRRSPPAIRDAHVPGRTVGRGRLRGNGQLLRLLRTRRASRPAAEYVANARRQRSGVEPRVLAASFRGSPGRCRGRAAHGRYRGRRRRRPPTGSYVSRRH